MPDSDASEPRPTPAALKNSRRRIRKIQARAQSATLGSGPSASTGASSDAYTSNTEGGASSDAGGSLPRNEATSYVGSSKRSTTHTDAPSSPEQVRRPTHKRSRVEISLNPTDEPAGSEPEAEASNAASTPPSVLEWQKGKARRGKRGGTGWKAQLARWKNFRAFKDLQKRGDAAKNVLRTLKFLRKEVPLPKDINDLSAEEAIKFANDHRVNEKENFYVFNAANQAEAWRQKNGVEAGQFKGKVLTEEDLKKYNFRIFDNGSIYAFEYNEKGDEELVFSAVFLPFSGMNAEELDDFRFLGRYFADRRDSKDGLITNNSAHIIEGAEGLMFAFGWRPDTDTRGGYRTGVYTENHPTSQGWVDSHGNHYRLAKIYSRLFHRQAPKHHGAANNYINTNRLPRLDDRQLGETTGAAPASNLTCTCNDFCNGIHKDEDSHRWTFGLWFPTYQDGRLVLCPDEVKAMTQGGQFVLPDHGFGVDFGGCAGVIALTWRGPQDLHGTVKSKTNPDYVRWGTSIQCAQRLKARVDLHWAAEEGRKKVVPGKKPQKIKRLKINDWFRRSKLPKDTHFSPEWYEALWDRAPGDEDMDVEEVDEIELIGVPPPEEIADEDYNPDEVPADFEA